MKPNNQIRFGHCNYCGELCNEAVCIHCEDGAEIKAEPDAIDDMRQNPSKFLERAKSIVAEAAREIP